MAIDSYIELRNALARWIHRADALASIPDFIQLAEARINADLMNVRPLWKRARATLTSGSARIAMPDDCMAFVGCALVLETELRELPVRDISYVQWTQTASGQPVACAASGEALYLTPAADQNYTLEMIYHQRIEPLNDSNSTNWVLENAPQMYLFGSLIESVGFTGETQRLTQWSSLYEAALNRLSKIGWEGPVRAVTDIPVTGGTWDINRG